ncbi:MAG: phosphate signaling complex protein PhoU [Candidatus Cloacimonetes bacterium]|nr:phosphate signaling complex protein PhoU [Candidatus Cloacimonadota bacterium]
MNKQRLDSLMKMLLEQASYVSKMVDLAIQILVDKEDTTKQINDYEQKVNEMENKLEEECISTIALNQPEARDLRQIVAIMKTNVDLERLADLTENIAFSGMKICNLPVFGEIQDVEKIALETKRMLENTIEAFSSFDAEMAKRVCEDDEIVDYLNRKIINDMLRLDYATHGLSELFHVVRISRSFERMADLTTNIAENTIYVASGLQIKHGAGLEKKNEE